MDRRVLGLALAIALLVGACSSGDAGEPREDGPFLQLLRLVPDTPNYRVGALMGDVERTLEALGIERPSGDYDETAVEAFVARLAEPGVEGFLGAEPRFLIGAGDVQDLLLFSANAQHGLGVSILDVEQWMMTGDALGRLGAIRGSFGSDAMDAALEACDECPAADIEEHRGWRIYAWGEDGEFNIPNRFQPPMFDQIGRGGRLAVSDQLIVRTTATDVVHAVVDAYEGSNSLADVEEFRFAVTAVEEMGALSMWVSGMMRGHDFAPPLAGLAEAWEVQPGDTVLVPYEVYAVGPGWDNGPYTAVVLVHTSEADAEENGRRIAARVASTRMLEDLAEDSTPVDLADRVEHVEVTVEGRVLRARLDGYAFSGTDVLLTVPLLRYE